MQKRARIKRENAPAATGKVSVTTAVIVAAGRGSRLRNGSGLPKPLVPLAGVPLIGRVMSAANRAGIKRFVVVAGYETALMKKELSRLVPEGCCLDVVENYRFIEPNGVSLSMAVERLEGQGPFALLMSDHVFSPERLERAIERFGVTKLNLLAVEPVESFEGDLDDATLVRVRDGRVEDIGKGLEGPDAVDTGMFVLWPAEVASALEEAGPSPSISGAMRVLARLHSLDAFDPERGWWRDVDTPEDFEEAERRLLASLGKSSDGLAARYVNRRVSVFLTKKLWPLGVTPNMVTAFTLLPGLSAGVCFSRGGVWWGLAGAAFFQLQSIIDGVDGELARLLHRQSRFGFWFDLMVDNITHLMVFGGIAFGLISEGVPGPWAILGVVSCLGVIACFFIAGPLLSVPSPAGHGGRLERAVERLGTRDFSWLLFPLAVLGWLGGFLWVAAFGIWVYAGAALSLRLKKSALAC